MSTIVTIRMQDKTLNQTEHLKNLYDAPSKSDVIRRAIELNEALAQAACRGDKIVIEGKSGKREIILPGLKQAVNL